MSHGRRAGAVAQLPARSAVARRRRPRPQMSRRALARVPAAGWMCALLAVVNAVCWSQVTPPFLQLDEPDHVAYVQTLAETGRLPAVARERYSPEETTALLDLRQPEVRFRPQNHPIFSAAQQQKLQRDLSSGLSRRSESAGVATSEPPLYYALQAIPYSIASGGTLLDRLALMRLFSALMGGLTALFVFLFLREALPAAPWAWTVGGVAISVAPLLGVISGAVNPDAMLYAVSAALFYCLARAFRRGLTPRLALATGAVIATGFLTKLNFIGLAPGAILGLVLLARRQARAVGMRAYRRSLAPALALAISPPALYALVNVLSNHHTFGIASDAGSGLVSHRSLSGAFDYIWQLYLPRLPGMPHDFGELFPLRDIWFRDLVGIYGWSDTVFPAWVYRVALVPAGIVAALCLRELVVARAVLRARAGEILTYGAMTLGLLGLIGAAGYNAFPSAPAEFTDARYLMPTVVLWATVVALAARGAGRRWGPPVGALIVVLAIAHDLFSQLQVIARYYS